MTEPFRGIFAILQSTFHEDGRFDEESFTDQAEFTVATGTHGIVWPVMASEFTVLSQDERRRSTELLLERVDHRAPVVIGVASVCTEAAVELARHAQAHGADAIISLPPHALKPTREQAFAFYRALSAAVDLPIFVQNAGGQLGMAFTADEVARMTREIEHLKYVKEETAPAGPNISRVLAACGDSIRGVFAGGACRELPTELERGAAGNMSATALADVFAEIYDRYVRGDHAGARQIHYLVLAYLNLQNTYGRGLVREVLRRRGAIRSAHPRFGPPLSMDEHDTRELEFLFEQLQPYFRLQPPTTA